MNATIPNPKWAGAYDGDPWQTDGGYPIAKRPVPVCFTTPSLAAVSVVFRRLR